MTEPFKLTQIEQQTAVWQRIEAHVHARLASHRRKNDDRKMSEADTAALRGQIVELKHLLSAAGESPGPDATAG